MHATTLLLAALALSRANPHSPPTTPIFSPPQPLPYGTLEIAPVLPNASDTTSNGHQAGPPMPWPPRADDALMSRCYNKGCRLDWGFKVATEYAGQLWAPPLSSAQSAYTWDSLAAWGWNTYGVDERFRKFDDEQWGMKSVLREMGISEFSAEDGGLNTVVVVHHADATTGTHLNQQLYRGPDGRTRRVTGAQILMSINPTQGVIMAMNRKSPETAAKLRDPPVTDLPDLRLSSDVMWGVWEHWTPPDKLNSLRWFFCLTIQNEATQRVIRRVLEEMGTALKRYPGDWIPGNTVHGQSLLGTPNGVGLGYFLIQHKQQLGNLQVNGVVLFHADTDAHFPVFAFSVGPATAAAQAGEQGQASHQNDGKEDPFERPVDMPDLPENFNASISMLTKRANKPKCCGLPNRKDKRTISDGAEEGADDDSASEDMKKRTKNVVRRHILN